MLQQIKIWLLLIFLLKKSSQWCLYKTSSFGSTINTIQYSPDRSLFVTTISQGTAQLWNSMNTVLSATLTPALGQATSARFHKNNTLFGVSTTTGNVYLYSTSPPYSLITSYNTGTGSGATTIDFSYDGTYLLICGGSNGAAKLINLGTGATTTTISFSNAVNCKFSPSNQFTITSNTNLIQYFSSTGTLLWSSSSFNNCDDLQVQGTSTTLVLVCNNGASRFAYRVNIATQTPTTIYTATGIMRTSQITGDGSWAAFSGDEKKVMFAKNSGASYVLQYNYSIVSEAYSSDFSNDGIYLLVGTKEGYIYQFRSLCLDCSVSHYPNYTTLKCQLCSQFTRACGACINSTYCTDCIQGYYIQPITVAFTTTRICLPCLMEGCIVCNTSTVCIRCEVGYYVTATNNCSSCATAMQGCLRCNTSSICQKCTHDFYLNSNKCTVCSNIQGCSLCANSSYCHVCQVGYYNNSGSCTACPTNCLACYSTTTCLDCRKGYYPTNTAGSTCSRCPTLHCLSCNQTGYCYECGTNTYLDSSGNCLPCAFPCSQCNGTICTNCIPGFFLDYLALGGSSAQDGGVCQVCQNLCITCISATQCISCPLGYYLITANYTCVACDTIQTFCTECTPTVCLNCSLGYFITTSNTCQSCVGFMLACVSCTSNTTCFKCGPGYYLTTNTGNSSCAPCTEGCQLCNSSSYCYGCIDGFYLAANNSCIRCAPPCTFCSSASVCLSCEQQYYLNGSTCTGCRQLVDNCITCDDQVISATVICTSCRSSYYLQTINYTCVLCTPPCLVCNSSSVCIQCEIGYFISGTSCITCPQNCTACVSASVCSSCSIGFYYNSGAQKCYHCTAIGCLTCNSTQKCLSCSPGYYLTASYTCALCLTSIKYCETCTSSSICLSCSFGYTLSVGNISCTVCSSITGCFDCDSLTSCAVCENGYFLNTSSGVGVCQVCLRGCASCNNNSYCITCLPGYLLQSLDCVLCKEVILGCQLCTSSTNCVQCSNGYYLSSNTCYYCRSVMKGCQFCNSSTVCVNCFEGYYLLPNNTCQICSITIPGCTICQSSSICKQCQSSYYLLNNICQMCSSAMPGCLLCTDNSTCLDCTEGYTIDAVTLQCTLCKQAIAGCISCLSQTHCQQCQAGYYLKSTDNLCYPCTQVGCQVCYETNPATCINCNTMYFLSSSKCYYCRNIMEGCIQCTSSWTCTLCDTGYFKNSTNKCQLCQTSIQGCGKCNSSSVCYQCKSTYYLNSTLNKCLTCLSALQGCAYCLDLSECISCSNNYYKNISTGYCQLCTNIVGCLACSSQDICILCQGDYFLQYNQSRCYPCASIQGCYSCIDNKTCIVCVGGYILNDDKICQIYQVQADQDIKGMKMISQYIDSSTLSHILFAHQMQYQFVDFSIQRWSNRTDIILRYPNLAMENLTIKEVNFLKSNQLRFFTNNPLNITLQSIPTRRLLYSMPEGYKTFLNMKQDMINIILPDLYMSHSLALDYDLSSPQFYSSIYKLQFSLYQTVFGIVTIAILTINYIVRAVVTCPNAPLSQHGQILPHFQALKAPPFIIFPLYPEQIGFSFGFMASQFPWARDFFSNWLSDKSQNIPTQYSLFYDSMSFGSTYMLAFIIGFIFLVIMWLYKKNNQKTFDKKDQKIKQELRTQINQHKKWGLPNWPLKMVMYNFFFFGLVFNGCASLQNAILNPLQQVSVSAAFTILGIICFGLALTDTIHSLYENPLFLYKIRVFIKATLLSLCHLSPIYIFSATIVIDILCTIIEYRLTRQYKLFPKLWIYNNFCINLCLIILVFIHSHIITLVFIGILLLTIVIIQFYVHYKEYNTQNKKGKFLLPKLFTLGQGGVQPSHVWNINFNNAQANIDDKQMGKQEQKKQSSVNMDSTQSKLQFEENQPIKSKKPKMQKKKDKNSLYLKEQSIQNLNNIIKSQNEIQNNEIFLAADFIN